MLGAQGRPGKVPILAQRHLKISALQMQLREQLADFRISRLLGQQLIENRLSPGKLFVCNPAGRFRQ